MFVTTAARHASSLEEEAKRIASELSIPYIPREGRSLQFLQNEHESGCLVAGRERMEIYPFGQAGPFFFHPNSASFRVKRLMRGETDPFVEAAELKPGMSMADCTLGIGSDAIVASYITGAEGSVIGIEANPYTAYVVRKGMAEWTSGVPALDEAMRRVDIRTGFYEEFLSVLPDRSIDCVYFDPMFDEAVRATGGIEELRQLAVTDRLSGAAVNEALRVARRRVVLKDHFRSPLFAEYGFRQLVRKSCKFHYGIIDLSLYE